MSLPLDLLRVFEAAARSLSFTSAAAELGTTQPAVSQQIKRLEKELAVRLFDRIHRGITLTDAGQVLLVHVQQGLGTIDAGITAITAQNQHEVLQVSTDFAFAAYWLMPRLPRFRAANPHLDVSLITSDRSMTSLRSDIDIAITFGDGRFKHTEASRLFSEEVFPICSPRLLEGRTLPLSNEQLAGMPLLHLKPDMSSRWFDWNGLFQALGITQQVGPAALSFDNYTLLIQAAIAGQGVAIGWSHLVDELLEQGVLCKVIEGQAQSRFGYYAVLSERKRRARLLQPFVQWLHAELGL
ncbi:choline sulfate utilization transcriptional regulator [Pseudomonas turukhanskensis]|uniref:choline sulfate utilization transcriptional regulator n=1 Tax=Pseudomonas turukhanskensis TaxID=1806536 RepID=UPI0022F2F634|nr:LysR family transcriptional regulator [Pseudomonas turukhanskensis]